MGGVNYSKKNSAGKVTRETKGDHFASPCNFALLNFWWTPPLEHSNGELMKYAKLMKAENSLYRAQDKTLTF